MNVAAADALGPLPGLLPHSAQLTWFFSRRDQSRRDVRQGVARVTGKDDGGAPGSLSGTLAGGQQGHWLGVLPRCLPLIVHAVPGRGTSLMEVSIAHNHRGPDMSVMGGRVLTTAIDLRSGHGDSHRHAGARAEKCRCRQPRRK